MSTKHQIPDWVTRGKTIRELIAELTTFKDQDREVRISLDYADTHHPISIVEKHGAKYCVLVNAESYHEGEWQKFMDQPTPPRKPSRLT
jgi:hypothetical protein